MKKGTASSGQGTFAASSGGIGGIGGISMNRAAPGATAKKGIKTTASNAKAK